MSYAFQKDSSLAKDTTVQDLQAVVEQINLSVNQGVVISGITDVTVTNDFATEASLLQAVTELQGIRTELEEQPDAVVVVSGTTIIANAIDVNNEFALESTLQVVNATLEDIRDNVLIPLNTSLDNVETDIGNIAPRIDEDLSSLGTKLDSIDTALSNLTVDGSTVIASGLNAQLDVVIAELGDVESLLTGINVGIGDVITELQTNLDIPLSSVNTTLEEIRDELINQPDAVVVVSGIDSVTVSNLDEVTTKIDDVITELQSLETSGEVTISGVVQAEITNTSPITVDVNDFTEVTDKLDDVINELQALDIDGQVSISGAVDVANNFATEPTLQALLDAFNNEDFASQSTLLSIALTLASEDFAQNTTLSAFASAFTAEDFAQEGTAQAILSELQGLSNQLDTEVVVSGVVDVGNLPTDYARDASVQDAVTELQNVVAELQEQPDAVVIVSGTTIIANAIDINNDTWATEVTALAIEGTLNSVETSVSNIETDVDTYLPNVDVPLSTLDGRLNNIISELQDLEVGGEVVVSGVNGQLEAIVSDLQDLVTSSQNIESDVDNMSTTVISQLDAPISDVINELQNLEVGGTVAVSGTVTANVSNPFALDSTLVTAITRLEEIRDELINQPDAVVVVSGIDSVEVSNLPTDYAREATLSNIDSTLDVPLSTLEDSLNDIQLAIESQETTISLSGTLNVDNVTVNNDFALESTAQSILAELQTLEVGGEVAVSGTVDANVTGTVSVDNLPTDYLTEVTGQSQLTELQEINGKLTAPLLVSGVINVEGGATEATALDQLTELQNIVSELQDQPDAVVIVSGTTIIANAIDINNDTWATEVTAQNIDATLTAIASDIDTPLSTLDTKLAGIISELQGLEITGEVVVSGVNTQLETIISELQTLEVEGTVAVSGTVSVDNPFALDSTLQTAINRLEEIRDELVDQPDTVVVVSGIESVEVSNFPTDYATEVTLQSVVSELQDLSVTTSGTVTVDNLGDIESKLDSVITELQSLDFNGTATISGIVDANVLNEFALDSTAQSQLTELQGINSKLTAPILVSGTINVEGGATEATALSQLTELQNIVTELQDQPDAVVIVSGTTIIANDITVENDTWATEVTAQSIDTSLNNIEGNVDIPLSTLDAGLDDIVNELQNLEVTAVISGALSVGSVEVSNFPADPATDTTLQQVVTELQNLDVGGAVTISGVVDTNVLNEFALDTTLQTAVARLVEIRDELIDQPDTVVVVSGIESVEVSNFPTDYATEVTLNSVISELQDLSTTVSGTVTVDNLGDIESKLDNVITELQSLEISGTATISGIVDANVLNEFALDTTVQSAVSELQSVVTELQGVNNKLETEVVVSGVVTVDNFPTDLATEATALSQLTELQNIVTELQDQPDAVVIVSGTTIIANAIDINNDTWATETTAQTILSTLNFIESDVDGIAGSVGDIDTVLTTNVDTPLSTLNTSIGDVVSELQNLEVTANISGTLAVDDVTVTNPFALDSSLQTAITRLVEIRDELINQPDAVVVVSGLESIEVSNFPADPATDTSLQTIITELGDLQATVSGTVSVDNLGDIETKLDSVITELQSLEISGTATISGIVDANVLNEFALDSTVQTLIPILEDVRTAVEAQSEATVSGTVAIANDTWATEVTAQAILDELQNQPDAVVIVSGSNIQIDAVTVQNDTWATESTVLGLAQDVSDIEALLNAGIDVNVSGTFATETTLQSTNSKLDDLINQIQANSTVTVSGAVTVANAFATETTQLNVLDAIGDLTAITASGTSGGSIAAIAVDELTYAPGFTENASAELAVNKDNGRLLTSELKHRIETGTLTISSTSTTFVNSNPIDLDIYDRVSILPNVTVAGGTDGDYSIEWSFDLVNWFAETIDSFNVPSGGESVVDQPVMIRRFDSSSTGLKTRTPVTLDKRARYVRIRQRSDSAVTLTTIYNYQLLELN